MPGDSKDWTWVLERRCPECRFDVHSFSRTEVGSLLRQVTNTWAELLVGDPGELRRRPSPEVWSPLEYAAHVRDVLALYSARLEMMMTEDGPHYPDWDQDATAVEKRYDQSDPGEISEELSTNGATLAEQFDAVPPIGWERTGFRSDGTAFTIESFARYLLHDPVHHLHDVGVTFAPDSGLT